MKVDYPWLNEAWRFLIDSEGKNRLGQAYLFKTQEKLGTETLIDKFAEGLICKREGLNACGICKNCTLVNAKSFPDLKRIELSEKQTVIPVEAIRELISFFSTKPAFGGRKIAIINPVEKLNFFAANALLKIIEEPPEHSFFLLNWETPRPVPRTLTSRCTQISIPSPSRESSLKWLTNRGINIEAFNEDDSLLAGSPVEIMTQIQNKHASSNILKDVFGDILTLSSGQKNIVKLSEKYQSIGPITLLTSLELLCHTISNIKFSHLPRKLFLSKKQNLNLQRLANNLDLTNVLEFNAYLLDIKSKCLTSDGIKCSDFIETLFFKLVLLLESEYNEK
tara:strand:- start:131 stop:1138 length:1008 start_codon:yes stop_codon:yes gene_type:complete